MKKVWLRCCKTKFCNIKAFAWSYAVWIAWLWWLEKSCSAEVVTQTEFSKIQGFAWICNNCDNRVVMAVGKHELWYKGTCKRKVVYKWVLMKTSFGSVMIQITRRRETREVQRKNNYMLKQFWLRLWRKQFCLKLCDCVNFVVMVVGKLTKYWYKGTIKWKRNEMLMVQTKQHAEMVLALPWKILFCITSLAPHRD